MWVVHFNQAWVWILPRHSLQGDMDGLCNHSEPHRSCTLGVARPPGKPWRHLSEIPWTAGFRNARLLPFLFPVTS